MRRDDETKATASVGNDGGRSAPGASAEAAPCRAGALRAPRGDAWRSSPLPRARWYLAVTRQPAVVPHVKQRLTVAEPKLAGAYQADGAESIKPAG
jgi:hypothetical protein